MSSGTPALVLVRAVVCSRKSLAVVAPPTPSCICLTFVVICSANTMSSCLEVLGMSLPYSSSTPATYAEKTQECIKAAGYLKRLLELDLKPKYVPSVIYARTQ